MPLYCEFEFAVAVPGFHVYRYIWKPYDSKSLSCEFEPGNLFDMISTKVCSGDGDIVGHLRDEVFIGRDAKVTITVRSKIIRRSPLFQGGLAIQCTVKVSMPKTAKGQLLMDH